MRPAGDVSRAQRMVDIPNDANRILHVNPVDWIFNDGGRIVAGYKGHHERVAGDCVTRSISLVTGYDYYVMRRYICAMINEAEKRGWYTTTGPCKGRLGKKCHVDRGVCRAIYGSVLCSLGYVWFKAPVGVSRACHLPSRGRFVLRMKVHLSALIDGTMHDTCDHRTERVYGWYRKVHQPEPETHKFLIDHAQY